MLWQFRSVFSSSLSNVSTHGTEHSPGPSVGLSVSVCLPVGRSVRKVYCGKTAERIWMPFGVLSGVDRGMGVLDGGGYSRKEGAF